MIIPVYTCTNGTQNDTQNTVKYIYIYSLTLNTIPKLAMVFCRTLRNNDGCRHYKTHRLLHHDITLKVSFTLHLSREIPISNVFFQTIICRKMSLTPLRNTFLPLRFQNTNQKEIWSTFGLWKGIGKTSYQPRSASELSQTVRQSRKLRTKCYRNSLPCQYEGSAMIINDAYLLYRSDGRSAPSL